MFHGMFGFSKITFKDAHRIITACYFGMLKRPPEKNILISTARALYSGKMNYAEFVEGIINSEEYLSNNSKQSHYKIENINKEILILNAGSYKKINRFVYFCFSDEKPIGGVKVISRHSQIINNLKDFDIDSEIFFPENLDFTPNWFDFDCPIQRNTTFNCETDFVVIPEMWVLAYGQILKDSGIRFGIFVQNGYLIFHEVERGNKEQLNRLYDIYSAAKVIISISNNLDECLKTIFPTLSCKIFRVTLSIDTQIFFPRKSKSNQICYMPRKLPYQSQWLVNLLTMKLGNEWKIVPIGNMTEKETAETLGLSKIFLSFSDQEGFALPPLEAAVSGNIVIGYTGEAAAEYFVGDMFVEIASGNLLKFFEEIMKAVQTVSEDHIPQRNIDIINTQISKLKERYSKNAEIESLQNLTNFLMNST